MLQDSAKISHQRAFEFLYANRDVVVRDGGDALQGVTARLMTVKVWSSRRTVRHIWDCNSHSKTSANADEEELGGEDWKQPGTAETDALHFNQSDGQSGGGCADWLVTG